ncbi:MAG: YdcF family protein [Pseudomonadota bacterium]
MEILITRSIETLLFPPGNVILLMVLGLVLLRRHRRTAVAALLLAALGLYASSIHVASKALLRALETYPALQPRDLADSGAQAIVVLGSGRYPLAPEYGGDSLADWGLERVRYGAWLHRHTGLPLVVTGGDPLNEGSPEAAVMQKVLRDDYGIEDVWTEGASRTTGENALFTRELLARHGIKRVYLVTQAWHMPRAVRVFQRAGLEVIPAPTHFLSLDSNARSGPLDWLPDAGALANTNLVLHELAGSLWYRVRY